MPGTRSVYAERVSEGFFLDFELKRDRLARYGLSVDDANAMVLRTLGHCTVPSSPLNVSGPETVSVRWLAESFGQRLGKPPVFTGVEAAEGWLVNTAEATRLFGYPSVPLLTLVNWTADWVGRGLPSLGKDTHYDTRDGNF